MHSEKGYTAIEMMVVLVLVGIASTIAIVDHSAKLPHNNLREASRDIVSKLRLIRQRAITTSTDTSAKFFVNGNVYLFMDVGEYLLPRHVRFGTPDELTKNPNTNTISSDTKKGLSFSDGLLSFEPNGTMSGGVNKHIYLTNAPLFSSGDELYREASLIEVNRTGQVKLYRWNGLKWQ